MVACHNSRMTRELRDRLTLFFEAAPADVLAAYVFGSAARGEDSAKSDLDVAVLLDRIFPPTLAGGAMALEGDLEREVGRPVDLVVLNNASADLVHRVLRDGVLVIDRDPARRIRFEVAKRNEYFDTEPLRRRYRQSAARPARVP